MNLKKPSWIVISIVVIIAALLTIAFTLSKIPQKDNDVLLPTDSEAAILDSAVDNGVEPPQRLSGLEKWHGNLDGKDMTLDDVRELAGKGNDLVFEDLREYKGGNISSSSDYYIMLYGVQGGYRLLVHSKQSGTPDSVNLESIWESGGSGIDIRYNDVDAFLQANPSQEAIREEEAQDMAQINLGLDLEPVSWYILGDWPEQTDGDAAFANALLNSMNVIGEPCWALRVKGTAEWGGQYYAVGKRSGTIYICNIADDGEPGWSSIGADASPELKHEQTKPDVVSPSVSMSLESSQIIGYWANIYTDSHDGLDHLNGFHFADDGTGLIFHSAEGAFLITSFAYADDNLSICFLNMEDIPAEWVFHVDSLSKNELVINGEAYSRMLKIEGYNCLGGYTVTKLDGLVIDIMGYY